MTDAGVVPFSFPFHFVCPGDELYVHQNAEGGGLGPFDCWLALRGLKTLALRMEILHPLEKQAANAQHLCARW